MSAWYVGTESLSMITDIISRYLVAGFNSFGFEFPSEIKTLFEGEPDERIFNALAGTNLEALEQRYDKETAAEMFDGKNYEDGHDIWQAREDGIQPWHYQLLKSLQCYIYQCSEGNVPDSPIYKAIDKLIDRLAMYIACNQKEYEEADWK